MASSINIGEGLVASYILDAAQSRFEIRATATGLLAAFGHNPVIAIRKFTGEVFYRPQAPERSSLRMEIDPTSLAVGGDVDPRYRGEMERTLREELLETARHPEIRFEGSAVQANRICEGMFRARIEGKLTLHGVVRDLEIPCTYTPGEDSIRANGEFTIRQTEYRIKLVSVAGGTLKLKDELEIAFDILGSRRPEPAPGA